MIKDTINTWEKIQQVNILIKENQTLLKIHSKNIVALNRFKNQQAIRIKQHFKRVSDGLCDKSHASLDMAKLNSRTYLREIKSVLANFPKSESVSLENTISLLTEGIDNMIQIYDRVETYKEQMEFSKFIVEVGSNDKDPLSHISMKYRNNIQIARELTTRNCLIDQFNRAKIAFSQYSFPFSSYYLENSTFSDSFKAVSSSTVDANEFISQIRSSIDNLNEFIDMDLSTIRVSNTEPSPDQNLLNDQFDSSTHPFFTWDYNDYRIEINKLLSGKEVTLVSDIKQSYYDVVKFSQVYLSIKCNDDEQDIKLQSLLSNFNVVLTHSGKCWYKFNYKIYEMKSFTSSNGLQLIHRYGNLESTNQSYKKLASSKPILSPYSNWKIQLVPIAPHTNTLFNQFSKFSNLSISLYLNGKAIYFSEPIGNEAKRQKDKMSDIIHKEYSNIFIPL
ncbi:hypothetical protein CYY_002822 [Polysphondylium violaceum]|uniref:Uncharacterized protein n=1 Tax=Polysphondylium violaceum TaxID=133409 RepID=A0A8J4UUT4_9MYCE|nr:hypothetical protein CYY_002822 [Polysphondylium violaceum]